MPFRSEAQRKYLWAKQPEIAKEWTEKYGSKARKKKSKEEAIDRLYKKRGG